MRIFIPSYNRSDTIATHKIFAQHPVTVLVHNEEQAKPYRDNGVEVTASNTPAGLANQRKWVMDQAEEGEWVVMLDDNIRRFKVIDPSFYHKQLLTDDEAKWKWQTVATEEMVLRVFQDVMDKADEENLCLAGIRPFSSPFYGKKKWKRNGFIRGKCMIVKKDKNLSYGDSFLEDMEFNCRNLLIRGGTMRCDYLYPDAPGYGAQAGGCGKIDAREGKLVVACEELMNEFPELLRYKGWKKSTKLGTDVQLKIYSVDQINKWRRAMAATGRADSSLFENYPY